jgi:hypothetical protein
VKGDDARDMGLEDSEELLLRLLETGSLEIDCFLGTGTRCGGWGCTCGEGGWNEGLTPFIVLTFVSAKSL